MGSCHTNTYRRALDRVSDIMIPFVYLYSETDIAAISAIGNALLGVPYREGGRSAQEGFDCVGWVLHVFRAVELPLPENFHTALRQFYRVDPPWQPLDVPMFRGTLGRPRHVGVMQDAWWCWQCSAATNGVARIEVTRDFWTSQLMYMLRHKALQK